MYRFGKVPLEDHPIDSDFEPFFPQHTYPLISLPSIVWGESLSVFMAPL